MFEMQILMLPMQYNIKQLFTLQSIIPSIFIKYGVLCYLPWWLFRKSWHHNHKLHMLEMQWWM